VLPRKTTNLGQAAEEIAVQLLKGRNYKIIERNFHSKFGEIDIVAVNEGALVFVEVKARWSKRFGAPEEAVTQSKLWKIRKTGEYFSILHPELPKKLRIDVVAIEMEGGKVASTKIIKVF